MTFVVLPWCLVWFWQLWQTDVNVNASQPKLSSSAYVKANRRAKAVQSDHLQLLVEVLLELSGNRAVRFNTPPVVIPPRAHGKWKRWCYFLLWAGSPGLTLYSCVPGYKAPLYNTDVIMGHLLTGSQITEMQPNWTFLEHVLSQVHHFTYRLRQHCIISRY